MGKLFKNSWALFLGMGLIMMAHGFQGSLLGVRAVAENFSLAATGFMMSGYFVGYFMGARTIPNVISGVGHIRVFAAFASIASLGILIHSIFINPFTWFVLRMINGFCMVCLFTVAESWLNDRSSNKNRGKVLSIYMIILYGTMGIGMFFLNFSKPENFEPFILISVIMSSALIPILLTNIFHCYNKENIEIDVFLEDYVYYSLLLITLYEVNNDKVSLKLCEKIMEETWELFFNKENNLLQKNILKSNDLFVQPIDIGDNNIPNGNSIYLLVCSKLKNITNSKSWTEKLDILSKSFHSFINYNFSQMFSYLKTLDICAESITVSLHGKINENIKKEILKIFMGNVSIIYKESEEDFFTVICKNATCSEKLKNLDQINEYIKNNL